MPRKRISRKNKTTKSASERKLQNPKKPSKLEIERRNIAYIRKNNENPKWRSTVFFQPGHFVTLQRRGNTYFGRVENLEGFEDDLKIVAKFTHRIDARGKFSLLKDFLDVRKAPVTVSVGFRNPRLRRYIKEPKII